MDETKRIRRMSAPGTSGFSLTELAVVVCIVLVLMAIAVPNLLQARNTAYEASATAALRTISMGQTTYFALYQGYAPSLRALGQPPRGSFPSASAADVIDLQLASGTQGVYRFRYSAIDTNGDGIIEGYWVVAEPLGGGRRTVFFVDQTGLVGREVSGTPLDKARSGSTGGVPP